MVILRLLKYYSKQIHTLTFSKEMVASLYGHVDIVDALIQAGADVNKQESLLGCTPLFFAIKGGKDASIIKTFLMHVLVLCY